MEGFDISITTGGHEFCTNGKAAFDATIADLIGDVLHSFEAGGAEPVYRAGGSCVGKAGSEGGGADDVGGSSFVDLDRRLRILRRKDVGWYMERTLPRQMSSTICGSILDLAMTCFRRV